MTREQKYHSARGNAMVYVLIALALLGFLTITLSRQNDQSDGQDLKDETVEFYSNELIEYTSAAQYAIELMLSSGSKIDDLNFVIPGGAGFETGSHIHKVFHPQGGGLNYEASYDDAIAVGGAGAWYFQNTLNVGWSDTAGDDVIMMAYNIKPQVCANINKKITGNTTIPSVTTGLDDIFNPAATTEAAFDATNCPACDGYPILCVSNNAVDTYGLYSIIAAQ